MLWLFQQYTSFLVFFQLRLPFTPDSSLCYTWCPTLAPLTLSIGLPSTTFSTQAPVLGSTNYGPLLSYIFSQTQFTFSSFLLTNFPTRSVSGRLSAPIGLPNSLSRPLLCLASTYSGPHLSLWILAPILSGPPARLLTKSRLLPSKPRCL